jgi:predicted permease
MALGLLAVRGRLIEAAGVRGLVLFVFTFSIPSLLLTSMAGLDFPPDIEWGFLVAFYAASLAVYGVGAAIGRVVFGRSLPEQAIFGMSAAFSNLVMIGIPVVLTALGPEAALPMMIIVGFHSATFMPLTVVLIQSGRASEGGAAVRPGRVALDAARNPIIVGIVLGLMVNLTGLTIPMPAAKVLELLGQAAVPCALFAMGASLAGYPLMGEVRPAVLLALLKLVAHPSLVWLIAGPVLGLEGLWVSVAVLMAAMPSAVNVYLFGARYEAAPGVAARTVLLTTVGSVVSLSVVLTLLGA